MREAHEHDPPISAEVRAEDAEAALTERLGDELQHLIEIVHFGHEMELFAKTTVGRFFVARAESQLNEATRQLLDMSSLSDTKTASDLHMKAKIAVGILRWMNEAVDAGRESELAIQGLDNVVEG